MTAIYVSDAHKEELSSIPARDMMRASIAFAMPSEDGVKVATKDVLSLPREIVEPIYSLLAETEQSFEGALTNAYKTLSHDKGFIERGGSGAIEGLKRGQWQWRDGGYEAAIDWLPAIEPLIELATEVALAAENVGKTDEDAPESPEATTEVDPDTERDAVDEIISISTEEDHDIVDETISINSEEGHVDPNYEINRKLAAEAHQALLKHLGIDPDPEIMGALLTEAVSTEEPESKVETKAEARARVKAELKAELKSELKAEVKREVEAEVKREMVPVAELIAWLNNRS